MVVERDKKPPENKSFNERLVDFSGGLNTTISGSLLNSNEAQVAINTSLEQKGTIRPRRGRRKRYTEDFAPTAVTGLGVYYKNDGTSRILVTSNDKIYADAPHMSVKWTEKADWEIEGTETSGYLTTAYKEGSITANQQELGLAGKCEDATLWYVIDGVLSTTTTNPYFEGSKAMEVLIDTGKTSAKAYVPTLSPIDSTKFAVLVGYVRRDTATNIKLVGLTSGNTVSKSGVLITSTSWVKTFMKLSSAELLNIAKVGVEVTGTANQRAFLGGMYFRYITEDEYNNASYEPPEITAYEVYDIVYEYNTSTSFNNGTKTNLTNVGDTLALSPEFSEGTKVYTSQADFDAGTKTKTSTQESVGSVVLSRQS